MDIDRIRGFISMMRLPDKVALTGGGLTLAAMDRPKLERTELGDSVMPYTVSAPSQLALGCTFSPELCAMSATAQAADAAKNGYAFAGAVRGGVIRDPMSVSACEFFSEDALVTAELLKSYAPCDGLGFVFTDCLGQNRFVNRTIDGRALYELYLYPLIKSGQAAAALQLDGGYLNGEAVCYSRTISDMMTQYIRNDAMLITQYGIGVGEDGLAANGAAYTLGQGATLKRDIQYAAEVGVLAESKLNRNIERTLAAAVNAHEFYKKPRSEKLQNAVMPDIVADSTVLLKNDGVLPTSSKSITIFGDGAEFKDGAAYSLIPIKDAPKKLGTFNVFLITGYEENGIPPAVTSIVCGAAAVAPTVVVLCGLCATPLDMADRVNAVLFCPERPRVGDIVTMLKTTAPRGHLPFTWCRSRSSYPCNNPKYASRGDFRYESVYNGYRLFNNFKSDVLFPFGHGLDYTEYDISKLNAVGDGKKLHVDFVIKNKGERAGTAVCQIYITLLNAPVYGITKRLAAFKRITLEKTENARIETDIDMSDFAVYDEPNDVFITVGGRYRIDVGLSSADIRASAEAKIGVGSRVFVGLSEKLAPSYYSTDSVFGPTAPEIERLLKVPFIKKPDEHRDLLPPQASAIKKPLKKAEKTTQKSLLPLVRYKITTTPNQSRPI